MDKQGAMNVISHALMTNDMKEISISQTMDRPYLQKMYFNFIKSSFYMVYVVEEAYRQGPELMKELVMPYVKKMQLHADRVFLLTLILKEGGDNSTSDYPEANLEAGFIPIYWEMDVVKERLIIPENQPNSYLNLEKRFREYFAGESFSVYEMEETNRKPVVSMALIAMIAVIWLFFLMPAKDIILTILAMGATQPLLIQAGEWWRLFTSIFLHFDANHLLMNSVGLFIFGSRLEENIKRWEFLLVFLGGGIAGNVLSHVYQIYFYDGIIIGAGASGGVYALIGAVFTLSLLTGKKIGGFSSYSLVIYLIWSIISSMNNVEINHLAHFGGFLWGFLVTIPMVRRRKKQIPV